MARIIARATCTRVSPFAALLRPAPRPWIELFVAQFDAANLLRRLRKEAVGPAFAKTEFATDSALEEAGFERLPVGPRGLSPRRHGRGWRPLATSGAPEGWAFGLADDGSRTPPGGDPPNRRSRVVHEDCRGSESSGLTCLAPAYPELPNRAVKSLPGGQRPWRSSMKVPRCGKLRPALRADRISRHRDMQDGQQPDGRRR